MIAVRAASASSGISATSAPARRAATAPRPPGYCFSTPSIPSESVTTRPRKPRSRRSRPVITFLDTEAGRPGSIARTSMWPIITAGASSAMASRNGRRSILSSCSRVRFCTGSARWLSVVSEPCPGKCLSTGTTPASW